MNSLPRFLLAAVMLYALVAAMVMLLPHLEHAIDAEAESRAERDLEWATSRDPAWEAAARARGSIVAGEPLSAAAPAQPNAPPLRATLPRQAEVGSRASSDLAGPDLAGPDLAVPDLARHEGAPEVSLSD